MKSLLRVLLICCLFGLLSCTRQPPELVTTGVSLSQVEMITRANWAMTPVGQNTPVTGAFEMSSRLYAEVNSKWLAGFMERYHADLAAKGVPVSVVDFTRSSGWDSRFNCTMFTDLYVADAGAELLAAINTHAALNWSAFSRPAIFTIWYTPDWVKPDPQTGLRDQHAIVLVLTESGPKFIDPQSQILPTGEVSLSDIEKSTIVHRQA